MNFNLRRIMAWSLPVIGIGYLACRKNGDKKAKENTESETNPSET